MRGSFGMLVPGGDRPGSAIARQLAPAAGTVLFTPTDPDSPALRVPFSTVLRGISAMTTSPQTVPVADEVSFTCSAEVGEFSPVEVFALGLTDPPGDARGTDLRHVGFEVVGDLGVCAIHTANPSVNEWNVVLNTDADEEPDFAVVGFDLGEVLTGTISGNSLGSLTIDLDRGTIVRAGTAFTQLNSGIVELLFLLGDVRLAAGAGGVLLYSRDRLAGGVRRRRRGGISVIQPVHAACGDRSVRHRFSFHYGAGDGRRQSGASGADAGRRMARSPPVQPGRGAAGRDGPAPPVVGAMPIFGLPSFGYVGRLAHDLVVDDSFI